MPSDKLTPGWLVRDLEKAEARVKYLNGTPDDDALVEAVRSAMRPHGIICTDKQARAAIAAAQEAGDDPR